MIENATRRGRPRGDVDVRIVAAARRRFLESGVDGASLRAIARDAGTNVGMVYYYFPTKEDLFFGVVERVYQALLADLARALDPELPVRERVLRMSARFGRLSEAEVEVVTLVVREAMASTARRARLVERFLRGHVPLVARAMFEGVARGELAARDPLLMTVATLALSVAPHLVRRAVPEQSPLPSGGALAEQLVDLLFHGIGRASPGGVEP